MVKARNLFWVRKNGLDSLTRTWQAHDMNQYPLKVREARMYEVVEDWEEGDEPIVVDEFEDYTIAMHHAIKHERLYANEIDVPFIFVRAVQKKVIA